MNNPELPLVKLDVAQTGFWFLQPAVRMLVGRVFAKKYGRCVVLTAELDAVGIVSETGQIKALDFPYRRFQMWQIANKPEPVDCECSNYYDMEVEGAWKARDLREHHPMCIYTRTAAPVFEHFTKGVEHVFGADGKVHTIGADSAKARIARPDAWTRKRDELLDRSVITTAGR